jgi:hypothetical protein
MKYILLISLFLFSCSKQISNIPPLGYSYMPNYINLDTLGTKVLADPSTLIDTNFQDFKTIPIKIGLHYFKNDQNKVDSIILPRGSLISEKKAALFLFYETEYKRLKVQLYYTNYLNKEFYDKSISAEKLYQNEIVRLKKECERNWFERNMIYIGFIGGILTAVITEYSVVKITK